jgi:putative PIN family toxin of toxin-antitoxin system
MRILFDTNVLVSAFIGSGMCYEVIDHSIDEHQIYYTDFIIAEFRKILKDKFHYPESLIKDFVKFITNFFIKGQTADIIENICRDSDDDQVLADALQNEIAVLVTGDKDLLDLKTYKGIKIISPQEYWKL